MTKEADILIRIKGDNDNLKKSLKETLGYIGSMGNVVNDLLSGKGKKSLADFESEVKKSRKRLSEDEKKALEAEIKAIKDANEESRRNYKLLADSKTKIDKDHSNQLKQTVQKQADLEKSLIQEVANEKKYKIQEQANEEIASFKNISNLEKKLIQEQANFAKNEEQRLADQKMKDLQLEANRIKRDIDNNRKESIKAYNQTKKEEAEQAKLAKKLITEYEAQELEKRKQNAKKIQKEIEDLQKQGFLEAQKKQKLARDEEIKALRAKKAEEERIIQEELAMAKEAKKLLSEYERQELQRKRDFARKIQKEINDLQNEGIKKAQQAQKTAGKNVSGKTVNVEDQRLTSLINDLKLQKAEVQQNITALTNLRMSIKANSNEAATLKEKISQNITELKGQKSALQENINQLNREKQAIKDSSIAKESLHRGTKALVSELQKESKQVHENTNANEKHHQSILSVVNAKGILSRVLSFTVYKVLRDVNNQIKGATESLKEFEKTIVGIQQLEGTTVGSFDGIAKGAIGLSSRLKANINDISKAMKIGLAAGLDPGEEIQKVVEYSHTFAKATESDIVDTINAVILLKNNYDLALEDIPTALNQVGVAAAQTRLETKDLITQMGGIASEARLANISLNEASAIFGLFANNLEDSSKAATAFRNIMTKIQNPTEEMKKWQEIFKNNNIDIKFGVSAIKEAGSFSAYMDKMANSIKLIKNNEDVFAELFGDRRAFKGAVQALDAMKKTEAMAKQFPEVAKAMSASMISEFDVLNYKIINDVDYIEYAFAKSFETISSRGEVAANTVDLSFKKFFLNNREGITNIIDKFEEFANSIIHYLKLMWPSMERTIKQFSWFGDSEKGLVFQLSQSLKAFIWYADSIGKILARVVNIILSVGDVIQTEFNSIRDLFIKYFQIVAKYGIQAFNPFSAESGKASKELTDFFNKQIETVSKKGSQLIDAATGIKQDFQDILTNMDNITVNPTSNYFDTKTPPKTDPKDKAQKKELKGNPIFTPGNIELNTEDPEKAKRRAAKELDDYLKLLKHSYERQMQLLQWKAGYENQLEDESLNHYTALMKSRIKVITETLNKQKGLTSEQVRELKEEQEDLENSILSNEKDISKIRLERQIDTNKKELDTKTASFEFLKSLNIASENWIFEQVKIIRQKRIDYLEGILSKENTLTKDKKEELNAELQQLNQDNLTDTKENEEFKIEAFKNTAGVVISSVKATSQAFKSFNNETLNVIADIGEKFADIAPNLTDLISGIFSGATLAGEDLIQVAQSVIDTLMKLASMLGQYIASKIEEEKNKAEEITRLFQQLNDDVLSNLSRVREANFEYDKAVLESKKDSYDKNKELIELEAQNRINSLTEQFTFGKITLDDYNTYLKTETIRTNNELNRLQEDHIAFMEDLNSELQRTILQSEKDTANGKLKLLEQERSDKLADARRDIADLEALKFKELIIEREFQNAKKDLIRETLEEIEKLEQDKTEKLEDLKDREMQIIDDIYGEKERRHKQRLKDIDDEIYSEQKAIRTIQDEFNKNRADDLKARQEQGGLFQLNLQARKTQLGPEFFRANELDAQTNAKGGFGVRDAALEQQFQTGMKIEEYRTKKAELALDKYIYFQDVLERTVDPKDRLDLQEKLNGIQREYFDYAVDKERLAMEKQIQEHNEKIARLDAEKDRELKNIDEVQKAQSAAIINLQSDYDKGADYYLNAMKSRTNDWITYARDQLGLLMPGLVAKEKSLTEPAKEAQKASNDLVKAQSTSSQVTGVTYADAEKAAKLAAWEASGGFGGTQQYNTSSKPATNISQNQLSSTVNNSDTEKKASLVNKILKAIGGNDAMGINFSKYMNMGQRSLESLAVDLGIKAYASGKIFNRPEVALVGERGKEYLFNERQMDNITNNMGNTISIQNHVSVSGGDPGMAEKIASMIDTKMKISLREALG